VSSPKTSVLLFLILLSVSFTCFAENAPKAVLEYFDDPCELEVYDFAGNCLDCFDFGTELLIGFAVQTFHTCAELRLEPNGSILKLAPDTFIKLIELQGLASTTSTRIAHISGQTRFVAARIKGENYAVETATAVLGVRGTDFVVETDETGNASVYVEEGIVEVYNPQTGSSAELVKGQIAETRREVLSIIEDEMEQVRRMIEESTFCRLDPDVVPQFDFEEYYNEFEYFKDIEAESYEKFFTDKDYFADYEEYIKLYRDYYESEMDNFRELYRHELEAVEQQIQQAEDAYKSEMDSFQEYLQNN